MDQKQIGQTRTFIYMQGILGKCCEASLFLSFSLSIPLFFSLLRVRSGSVMMSGFSFHGLLSVLSSTLPLFSSFFLFLSSLSLSVTLSSLSLHVLWRLVPSSCSPVPHLSAQSVRRQPIAFLMNHIPKPRRHEMRSDTPDILLPTRASIPQPVSCQPVSSLVSGTKKLHQTPISTVPRWCSACPVPLL